MIANPWQRYGWVLWSAWLIFLVFPVLESLDASSPARVVGGLVGTTVFGTAYVAGFLGLFSRARSERWLVAVMGVLVLVALVTAPAIGLGVMSFMPFLQSLGMFALPRPANWWWTGAVVATTVVVPWALDPSSGWIFLTFIVVAVAVGTGAGRLMSDLGEEYGHVQEELTLVAERDRVARDVHDVLGHSLTVVSVKAELAARLVHVDPDRAEAELRDVQALARQALAEVRATVGGLRVARIEDELSDAATALRATGIEADLPGDAAALEPRHRAVAAWVLREAVTNVVRHSGAARCRVELGAERVAVLDDGRGLTGTVLGNGLRGLRERVEASGGRLRVGGRPDGPGTTVEVSW